MQRGCLHQYISCRCDYTKIALNDLRAYKVALGTSNDTKLGINFEIAKCLEWKITFQDTRHIANDGHHHYQTLILALSHLPPGHSSLLAYQRTR